MALTDETRNLYMLEALKNKDYDMLIILALTLKNRKLFDKALKMGARSNHSFEYYCENSVFEECKKGNMEQILLNIDKYSDIETLNNGLDGACKGNHFEVISLMISMGANDYESALISGCNVGNKKIVELILSKIETDKVNKHIKFMLTLAYRSGNVELVDYLETKYGLNEHDLGMNLVYKLEDACRSGNVELVSRVFSEIIRKNGRLLYLGNAMKASCNDGSIEIINFICETSRNKDIPINWDSGLNGACMGGNFDIIKMILSNTKLNYDAFRLSCRFGDMDIIRYLVDNSDIMNNIQHLFYKLFEYGSRIVNPDVYKFVVSKCSNVVHIEYLLNQLHDFKWFDYELYRMYCTYLRDKCDTDKLIKLCIRDDPIYFLVVHKYLPPELLRMVKQLLYV